MASDERDDNRYESDNRRRDDRDRDDDDRDHRRRSRRDDDDDRPRRRRNRYDEGFDRPRYQKSNSAKLILIIVGVVAVLGIGGILILLYSVQKVREAAARTKSQANLKQLAVAMHDMQGANFRFPPAAICNKQGKPLLSWRVAILPFVEQAALYKQFRLDEPWDSPTNKSLIPMMPKIYAPLGDSGVAREHMTYYRMIVPKGEIGAEFGLQDLVDLGRNPGDTIMIVEAGDPVIWTKPDELEHTQGDGLPPLGGLMPKIDTFNVAFYDGSVRAMKRDEIESLKAMIRPKVVRFKK